MTASNLPILAGKNKEAGLLMEAVGQTVLELGHSPEGQEDTVLGHPTLSDAELQAQRVRIRQVGGHTHKWACVYLTQVLGVVPHSASTAAPCLACSAPLSSPQCVVIQSSSPSEIGPEVC